MPFVQVREDAYVDISDLIADYAGAALDPRSLSQLSGEVAARVKAGRLQPLNGRRVGPPISMPHQIVCIGLNYVDHATEAALAVPAEPVVFLKSPNTLAGPDDDVHIPRGATKADWEVELGVVVGRRCRYLESLDEAQSAIVGYTVVNDLSERGFQFERGGQWSKGKSAETFNPCGPVLVTADEIDNVGDLDLWLDVDGRRMQSGNTRGMIFSPAEIVHYLSQFMVLEAGDLINTGTPAGVGMGMKPPAYLRPGQVMRLGIRGLGEQRHRVVAAP